MKSFGIATLLLPLAASVAAQTYHVIDLGTLGGASSRSKGINGAGQIVGYSVNGASQQHAFLYSGGVMFDLGTLGGITSEANAINNSGLVVGDSLTAAGNTHAFSFSGNGLQDIGTLGGNWNQAFAVNNLGQIVGISNTVNANEYRAYLYSSGTYTNLGTLGGDWSYANGINNSGVIAGDANTASEMEHGFRYSGGVMTDLGTLPNATNGSTAYAVNASGQIAGYSYQGIGASSVGLGFIANGTSLTPLGVLPGHGSLAFGINTAGVITGGSEFGLATGGHGFYWANGTITDLNSMTDPGAAGWTIQEGIGINDNYWIAGTALNPSGQSHAVLMIPWTQPTSFNVFRGIRVSGNLNSLFYSDHNYLQLEPGVTLNSTEAPVQLVVDSTAQIATASTLKFDLTCHADTSGLQTSIDLFDWNANAYVNIATQATSTSDTTIESVGSNSSRFIKPGTNSLRARISYRAAGPVARYPWNVFIDMSDWLVLP